MADLDFPNREISMSDELLEQLFAPYFVLDADIGAVDGDDHLFNADNDSDSDTDNDLMNAISQIECEETQTPNQNVDLDSKSDSKRFARVDDAEMEEIIEGASSLGTKKMTKYGVNIFRQWLGERDKDLKFEEYSVSELDSTLKEFYAEVRNAEGNLYAKSTFVGIRASVSRHLRSPPYNKTFNILADTEFHKSNQMFLAMVKKLKREGMDKTKHHPSIADGDMEKLRVSGVMSTETPRSLQRKVWFDIMISFGRRGRENQRNFTDKTFELKTDDRGCEFVEMIASETTKNHSGDLTDNDFEVKPRMYASGEVNCPVVAFKKYILKRSPSSHHFFQQPRPKVKESDQLWYTSRPVGEKTLNDMMKEMSKEAGLSKIYTNHCIRATTVSVLAHAGVANREIMKITGHKCEASLDSYNADSSDHQKRSYSAILHSHGKVPAENFTNITRDQRQPLQSSHVANAHNRPVVNNCEVLNFSCLHVVVSRFRACISNLQYYSISIYVRIYFGKN